MKLAVFTTFTPEYSFAEACRMIAGIGFEGVQPRIVPDASAGFDPGKDFNPWGNNRGAITESAFFADPVGALKAAKDNGLAISSVASYASTGDMDRAVRMVQACGKAGIRNVRIGSLGKPKDKFWDYPAFIERSRALYRELVAEAKKAGVRPCLELHNGTAFPGPSGVRWFLDVFAPEDVGVLYDPGNMVREGWEDPYLSMSILGPYLAEVHVKNTTWERNGEVAGAACWNVAGAELEEGIAHWPTVIEALRAAGYDGWLIEEGHTQGNRSTLQRLRMAHDFLRPLIAAPAAAPAQEAVAAR